MHECPPIDVGTIRFQYKGTERKVDRAHVQSVVWNACKDGKI
nr:MAG TPA: DNA-binding domain protein [Bacteriophage sp.]